MVTMKKTKILLIIGIILITICVLLWRIHVIAEAETIKVKAQRTRPFNDDDYDGKEANDTYRFIRRTRIR